MSQMGCGEFQNGTQGLKAERYSGGDAAPKRRSSAPELTSSMGAVTQLF
jgi:hypothetical protein